jgi:hypothetical protein
MRKLLATITILWIANISFGQTILSGEYNAGLKLAYDSITNKLTGYFENYTGYDEETRNPRFSCIFYIHGKITGSQFTVDTYFPNDTSDIIKGNINIINSKTASIKLLEDHGGCWNVQHFADDHVKFDLEKQNAWYQIRYVTTNKTYFYSNNSLEKRKKYYLIKNDIVFIEKILNDWAYCSFNGKTIIKGWIRTADLNKI